MAKKQLAFSLSALSISAAEIDGEAITFLGHASFVGTKDFQYKEQLNQFIQEKLIASKEYDEYSLSWFSPFSSLVPMGVFAASSPKAIFAASFNEEVTSEVDYNRISELSIVNVYSIPDWVKSFFVIRYPRIVIQHEGTHALRGIFEKSTFKLTCHLNLKSTHFQLIIVEHNALRFFNTFEFSAVEDILYYLAFTFQQLQIIPKSSFIQLHAEMEEASDVVSDFTSKLNKMADFSQIKPTFVAHSSFKFQKTCV
jgi:hypothetical protein